MWILLWFSSVAEYSEEKATHDMMKRSKHAYNGETIHSLPSFIAKICFNYNLSHHLFINVPTFRSLASFLVFSKKLLLQILCFQPQVSAKTFLYAIHSSILFCLVWCVLFWSPLCLAAVDWIIGSLFWLDYHHWLMKAGGSWQHSLLHNLVPTWSYDWKFITLYMGQLIWKVKVHG